MTIQTLRVSTITISWTLLWTLSGCVLFQTKTPIEKTTDSPQAVYTVDVLKLQVTDRRIQHSKKSFTHEAGISIIPHEGKSENGGYIDCYLKLNVEFFGPVSDWEPLIGWVVESAQTIDVKNTKKEKTKDLSFSSGKSLVFPFGQSLEIVKDAKNAMQNIHIEDLLGTYTAKLTEKEAKPSHFFENEAGFTLLLSNSTIPSKELVLKLLALEPSPEATQPPANQTKNLCQIITGSKISVR